VRRGLATPSRSLNVTPEYLHDQHGILPLHLNLTFARSVPVYTRGPRHSIRLQLRYMTAR